MDLLEAIEKYALDNAVKYNGKANPGAVIGHLISEHPEIKSDMKNVSKKVIDKIKEINKLGLEKQRKLLEEKYPEMLEKKEKEVNDSLKELEGVDAKKGVIMRFAPSPSGPMHIGHAITGGLTSLYVEKYGGKFILRIEDTNSDNIYVPAYEQLPRDGEWIFGNVTDVWIQSDRLKYYYDYVEKFLDKNAVYVCTCSQDEFKEYVAKMQDCPCRNLGKDEQKKRWKKMFDKEHGFKEGEAVVRLKSNMQDKNPAMRDFPLARINDSEHPRQGLKYRVWPLMNLSVFVDDVEAGMTHIIRAKDHADNAKRQEMMYSALAIAKVPRTYFVGRYNFDGLELSCSKTKERINACEFSGWDDIRLPFLVALKRRGYMPQAFRKYTRLVGISPVDKTVSAEEFFKAINSYNKEIIDPIAHRYFLIRKPHKIIIKDAPAMSIELDLHPENKKGGRHLATKDSFFIEENDYKALTKTGLYRLMDCLNFKMLKNSFKFVSKDYETFKKKGKKIIHWLPAEENLVKVSVLMPDNKEMECLGEPALRELKVGDIIQAERFGFMRLDKKEKDKLFFWFTHQ